MFSIKVPVFSIGDQRDTFPKQPSYFINYLLHITVLSYYHIIILHSDSQAVLSVERGRT